MKAFIASEFGYCPLAWVFHGRKLNSWINRIHEKALRIVYQDYLSSFAELLEKDNSTTIHNKNIQLLPIELFKKKKRLLPLSMREIFVKNAQHYNFRKNWIYKK